MSYDYSASHHQDWIACLEDRRKVGPRDGRELNDWIRRTVDKTLREMPSIGVTRTVDLATLHQQFRVSRETEKNDMFGVKDYRRQNRPLAQPGEDDAIPLHGLPDGSWLLTVRFQLVSDLICRDDQAFHLIDNPVKKDRVRGYPEYWGPSWKGILRQAYRSRFADERPDAVEEERLFGSVRGTDANLRSGRLRFFTTRFGASGFVTLNPSARKKDKASAPIPIETVPPKTRGVLRILYCPWDGFVVDAAELGKQIEGDACAAGESVRRMFQLGIGAKSSSGFGEARIESVALEVQGTVAGLAERMASWVKPCRI